MSYLEVIYSKERRPYTSYPGKLCSYLKKEYFKPGYKTLLDIGCGRGEHIKEFQKLGYKVKGVDKSEEARLLVKDVEIKIVDIENNPLPYPDKSFDVVFSKSVIEHLNNPDNIMKETYRILKDGGRLILMTPDWEAIHKIFYEDYTHKTPFTKGSLEDINKMFGFRNVSAIKFKQLPVLWKYPILNVFSNILYYSPKSNIKFIKYSKEIMLLSSAEK